MERSRRALLAAVGVTLTAPVAGCPANETDAVTDTRTTPRTETAETPSQTATRAETANRTETETPTATDPVTLEPGEAHTTRAGWSLTVETLAVRTAVVEFGTTHPDPRWAGGHQFVTADLVVSGEGAPDPADLRVTCRTDTVDRSSRVFVAADSNRDNIRQRVGFEVPVSPAPTEGAVVWAPEDGPEVRWALPDDHLAAIARPPEFELRSFAVEDAPGDEIEVTLTVANVGEGDGIFLAEVGDAASSDQPEVAIDVPAGETRTATRRVRGTFGGDGELTVVLRWRDTRLERTLEDS